MPHGHSAPILRNQQPIELAGIMNSFVFDWVVRSKQSGLHLVWAVLEELPLPPKHHKLTDKIISLASKLNLSLSYGCLESLRLLSYLNNKNFLFTVSEQERIRCRICLDTLIGFLYGLEFEDIACILRGCDLPVATLSTRVKGDSLDPKGFWRVDKNKDTELRHTVLTLVAFHDLEQKIHECGGDREKGIEAFLNQNDGEGWMLPETLRLADYGLGHDERAKEHQPVASRLGPRFYDWQLAQSPEESWRECYLHARNLLGQNGYLDLLAEVLRDTSVGGWRDSLKYACDLAEKENLLKIFSTAFGYLSPDSWRNRFEEARKIFVERGFTLDPADMIRILVEALKQVPKEDRPGGIIAARRLQNEADFRITLGRLLAPVLKTADDPWHVLAREHLGTYEYRQLVTELEAESPGKISEPVESYTDPKGKMRKKGKMTQMGLFD